MQTSWTALRLALPGFIIPFIIAYDPVLLMDTTEGPINYTRLVIAVITAIIGIYALSVGMGKYIRTNLNIVEQVLMIAVAFLLISTNQMMDILGIFLVVILMSSHFVKSWRSAEVHNETN